MAAAPALIASKRVAEGTTKALTGDIVRIDTQYFRIQKVGDHEILTPIDVEIHVNPVSVGAGLLAAGIALAGGALAAWWMGLGLAVLTEEEKVELQRLIKEEENAITRNEAELLTVEARAEAQREECFDFAHRVRVSRGEEEGRRVLDECLGKIQDTRQLILDDIANRKTTLKALMRRLTIPVKVERRKRFAPDFKIF